VEVASRPEVRVPNMMHGPVDYDIRSTSLGTWRRYVYPNGRRFAEFRSHAEYFGWPLIHYTYGICPNTGKRVVARGVIAVGRVAVGVIALGQVAAGVVAFGQAAAGVIGAVGQSAAGTWCVGQAAIGLQWGIGQIATGLSAVGQFAAGEFVLAQMGLGQHVWSMTQRDPLAVEYFRGVFGSLLRLFG
jgi:hypothetical protein